MTKRQAEFDKQLRELAQSYAHRLREQLGEIQGAWKRAASDGASLDGMNTMQRMVHTVAGSAATFGFPKVSDAARRLDVLLTDISYAEITANEEVREKIEVLVADLTQVISRS